MGRTSLLDMLLEPAISLHLVRFTLFLFFAIFLELVCSLKRVCVMCSLSTVLLQLVTGVAGLLGINYVMTSTFLSGDRVVVPYWYYPVIGLFLFGLLLVFIKGAKSLLKERLVFNFILRCVLFGITLYFAITVVRTPSKVNTILEKRDAYNSTFSSDSR